MSDARHETNMDDTLKRALAAFREAELPVLVGGSMASWARGGPRPQHDLDFVIRPADAERALEVLAATGMRTERAPEGWLYKAWNGDVMIDLIFSPTGLELTDEVFERADEMEILAVPAKVMSLEDALTTKLLSIDEHTLDYSSLLQIARALREQIDWEELRERTRESPFAAPFFVLVEELKIAPAAGPERGALARR